MCILPLPAFYFLVMPNHLLFPENAVLFHTSLYLRAISSVSDGLFLLNCLPNSCLVVSSLEAISVPPWHRALNIEGRRTMRMLVT